MSDFLKTFLRERIGDENRPWEHFGIFGKHPGWNDHIEDLPLPTMSMALAKQLLYVQGIGSQISSGAWARLPEEVRLADFDHAFLWLRGRSFLVGRIWGSRDGKKRAHFPMITLVQGASVSRDALLGSILAQLEVVASACRDTRSADDVRAIVSGAEEVSRSPATPAVNGAGAGPTLHASRDAVVKIARDFRQNPSPSTRLPADPNDLPGSLRFWSRVCAALAPSDVPMLFLAPLREPWLDVLINEPAPQRFFCLRACPPAVPIAHHAAAAGPAQELDADEIAKTAAAGRAPAGNSWISRLLGH
jgi:hypothetical protein